MLLGGLCPISNPRVKPKVTTPTYGLEKIAVRVWKNIAGGGAMSAGSAENSYRLVIEVAKSAVTFPKDISGKLLIELSLDFLARVQKKYHIQLMGEKPDLMVDFIVEGEATLAGPVGSALLHA